MDNFPLTQDLVLIGGGHTHALVLKRWGMQGLPGVRVTLINPGPNAPYSGMLPGFVAGHYARVDLDIDLYDLCRFAGARIIDGAATGIDLAGKLITVPGRPAVAYDVASIDIGITSAMPDLPGFAEFGIPAKPLGEFAGRWDAFRGTVEAQVTVIGGGVAGAELAMAMAFALRGKQATIHLIDQGPVLSALGPKARAKGLAALAGLGVTLIEGATVAEVRPTYLVLTDGRHIRSDFTTGAAAAQPHGWLLGTGLGLDNGFIGVNADLRTSDPAIFAVGDCAHMTASPRPKAGVFAVRQAPVLFDNLRAALSGGALRPYKPQRDYLKLISLGRKQALAEKWGGAWSGGLLWRLKDRIDRDFMWKFRDLPVMPGPELPGTVALGLREALGDRPLCGGCGAKVGRNALREALATTPPLRRTDVTALPGDDAAVLHIGGLRQVISTDHLRAVTTDPVLMARIAALHALGDIWAMGAAPQAATATIILPRMSPILQRRTLTEIMAAATGVMTAAGAAIVGGHTSLGDEMTIGFTVTGLCDRDPITLRGAQDGDAIILTKPLGSGVILAGAMQGKTKGADLAACFAAMCQGQGHASVILQDANAMTDVTGFGLAGHLMGICEASGVGAELDLDAIPLMQGANHLAGLGVRSSIWADNRAGLAATLPDGPRADLLFDPQTAGGLLAAVDPAMAPVMLDKLRTAGYPAEVIGVFRAGPAHIWVARAGASGGDI